MGNVESLGHTIRKLQASFGSWWQRVLGGQPARGNVRLRDSARSRQGRNRARRFVVRQTVIQARPPEAVSESFPKAALSRP
jgi:hypothetical protein